MTKRRIIVRPKPRLCDGRCGRPLTQRDKEQFEAEGGEGWPRCCWSCADEEAAVH